MRRPIFFRDPWEPSVEVGAVQFVRTDSVAKGLGLNPALAAMDAEPSIHAGNTMIQSSNSTLRRFVLLGVMLNHISV